ncbi:MAG TPA: HAMP domain-containing sensor histidine kinase [Chitinophagales bacterium]|nr:HAMP domain-containing sensor histidine kinase [Chitinophagales bacterium]
MTIQPRLTVYFTMLVMALVFVLSFVSYISIQSYSQQEFYSRLEEKARITADLLLKVNEVDSAILKSIDRSEYDLLSHENISIYNASNHEIYTNNDSVYFKTSPGLFAEIRSKKYVRYAEGPHKVVGIYLHSNGTDVVVTAGAIDVKGDMLLRKVRTGLFITLVAAMFVTLIMGWFFVGQALHPITTIITNVRNLSPVEHSERLVPLTEKDEIADLVSTFNGLFDKLEDSFNMQRGFVSNASHELFNPLTKIKSQLEVSLIQNRNSESYRETMHSVLEDLDDLILMIQDLLNFSRLQTNHVVAHSPLRIDELLFDIRTLVRQQYPAYQVHIHLTNPPQSDEQLIFYGNRQLLTTAIKNIVENACKYSQDGTAQLNLMIEGESISLSIADKGPGIPAETLPFIFEPFYRSPGVDKVKGFGIGLALAHRILKAHKFSIKVESTIGIGTKFTIRFSN